MKVIILNSGMGTRLGDLTCNNPKSLVNISLNETIFSRAINILSNFNFDEFIITTGYLSSVLKEYAVNNFPDINFNFIYNPVYDKTNYIKSMDLIPDFEDDVVLLHGDLVFTNKVAEKIIKSKQTSVVVDSTLSIPQDDFKAKIENDLVKYIGVDYFKSDAVACQPFYKLTSDDWNLWKGKIKEFCSNNKTDVYAENALNTITDEISITPIDLKGLLCMEVDTKDDLNNVKRFLK